jgi:hypothetical protein
MKLGFKFKKNTYSSAVHSALDVGLLKANMMGRLFNELIFLIISVVKTCPCAAHP